MSSFLLLTINLVCLKENAVNLLEMRRDSMPLEIDTGTLFALGITLANLKNGSCWISLSSQMQDAARHHDQWS